MDTAILRVSRQGFVSDAIKIRGIKIRENVRDALAVIDSVHRDGELPIILVAPSRAEKRYDAKYRSIVQEGDNKNQAMEILLRPESKTPLLSFFHEIGHFIDEQAWTGHESASSCLPDILFQNWFRSVWRSEAHKHLRRMLMDGFDYVSQPDGGYIESPTNRRYLLYLLDEEELWARCYAQYIYTKAIQANHPLGERLKNEFAQKHASFPGQIYYPATWTDTDFKPIMETMDAIFTKREWLYESN